MKVGHKVGVWQQAGLIDAAQGAAIVRWEEEHAGGARWVASGLGAAGALAILTGVVSVIAANWDVFPAWTKLAACGVLLLATLAGVWLTAGLEARWPRDLFLFCHDGMVLASVGLVAQVYHLHGHPWRAAALCAALALPAALIASRGLLTYVLLGHVSVLGYLLVDEAGWVTSPGHAVRLGAATFGLVLLCGARFVLAAFPAAGKAARRWAIALLAFAGSWAAVSWSTGPSWGSGQPQPALYPSLAAFVVAALVLGVLQLSGAWRSGKLARLVALGSFVILLVGATAIVELPTTTGSELLFQVIGFALSCVTCAALALASASAGDRTGTNLATIALALRILLLYLELAKDLMTTGLGLILTGVVVLAIAFGWWRLRKLIPSGGVA